MHTLILPATPEHLAMINAFLEQEIPENFRGALFRIETAVEELLMNIFYYAYASDGGGQAMLSCRLVDLDGQLLFRVGVQDWGRPYNPFTEAPVPDLNADIAKRKIGGLGLHIVKKVAAHYCYSRWQDSNDVELFFAPSA
jgi:anti-sigma regulatory factor (Ser/Thr protein kinase)